ncbi:NAD(P)/FAD-dependent oxidoreductase [Fodinicola feengrottensis]|uniref:FAD-dependent oxidoreductase n=1 Tax=Fodinicola feengrottensis TaxID=435914 RepID=A0ABN2IZ34_9ACTN|nr:FAD-dependent oxidoreductase [Fodinicola feengrottensis]
MLVIGAGVVGAACAYACTAAGLTVTVVDRGAIAGGTTSAGEGNILVSDKEPGPELDLALLSSRLWQDISADLDARCLEYESKGGVVVAGSAATATGLRALTAGQRAVGVDAVDLDQDELFQLEPNISRDVVGGALYRQDAQVHPMLATVHLLRRARQAGAVVRTGTTVVAFLRDRQGAVIGVKTDPADEFYARWVINAAGTWAGQVAELAGAPVPVLPRRGFVLVTEPLPRVVRHKVYTAEYLANVASDDAGLETSVVVEGTKSGTVLIGASRERVGFDRTFSLPVLRRLATQAIGVFPFLEKVSLLRSYLGFRPYCPDHLPVIGPDPRVPGLVHACGHEGAGIGLAAATGHVIAQLLTDQRPAVDLTPLRPHRFEEAAR